MTAAWAEPQQKLTWWRADPARLAREQRQLRSPWRLELQGDRYAWVGGTLQASHQGVEAPASQADLIYPTGFPARFMEVRLIPNPPRGQWGVLGAHLNVDGSACFITGESWTPQMTAQTALALANDWWFNFWVIVEKNLWNLDWPSHGRVALSPDERAALHRR